VYTYCYVTVRFRHNQFGAVNISNSPNVVVKNCTFDSNTFNSSKASFRRSPKAGGLSISYITERRNTTNRRSRRPRAIDPSEISIVVTECYFKNNIAIFSNRRNSFLSRGTSGSEGGGLAIAVRAPARYSTVNCVVNNSVFINNTSNGNGGGLFCVTLRAHGHQTYTLKNLTFMKNYANIAGALYYRSTGRNDNAIVNTKILHCTFLENNATVAGAVTISFYNRLINNSVMFNGCNFAKNLATDYAGTVDIVSSYNFFVDRSRYTPIAFTDWLVTSI